MNPVKPGGGNKLQFYDPDNGKYTEEEKTKLFDEEMTNIVCRYIFGLPQDTYYPRFPIFGFHNNDYARLYAEHAITNLYKDIPYEKISNYLLKYREKDDKSHFFNLHGYYLKDRDELLKEIYYGSDFSRMKFQKFNEFGIFVAVPTTIKSKAENKKILFISYWMYSKENDQMHFISVNVNKKEIERWVK